MDGVAVGLADDIICAVTMIVVFVVGLMVMIVV